MTKCQITQTGKWKGTRSEDENNQAKPAGRTGAVIQNQHTAPIDGKEERITWQQGERKGKAKASEITWLSKIKTFRIQITAVIKDNPHKVVKVGRRWENEVTRKRKSWSQNGTEDIGFNWVQKLRIPSTWKCVPLNALTSLQRENHWRPNGMYMTRTVSQINATETDSGQQYRLWNSQTWSET